MIITSKAYLGDITSKGKASSHQILSKRWRRKPAGIDMERNGVTVSPCISNGVFDLLNPNLDSGWIQ